MYWHFLGLVPRAILQRISNFAHLAFAVGLVDVMHAFVYCNLCRFTTRIDSWFSYKMLAIASRWIIHFESFTLMKFVETLWMQGSRHKFYCKSFVAGKINVNDPKSFINQCYQMAHVQPRHSKFKKEINWTEDVGITRHRLKPASSGGKRL